MGILKIHNVNNVAEHTILMGTTITKAITDRSKCISKCEEIEAKRVVNEQEICWFKFNMDTKTHKMDKEIFDLKQTITKMQKDIDQMGDDITKLSMENERLECTSYNGEFVWKVTDVWKHLQNSKTGKMLTISSLPFHDRRCGYKMSLKLNMNGDGPGRNTHLSLFMVVMKGMFDDILDWPMKKHVTFTLFDQSKHKKHIVQTFLTDQKSESFMKPTSDVNTATGFPEFCSSSILNNKYFVRNETMYFKVLTKDI